MYGTFPSTDAVKLLYICKPSSRFHAVLRISSSSLVIWFTLSHNVVNVEFVLSALPSALISVIWLSPRNNLVNVEFVLSALPSAAISVIWLPYRDNSVPTHLLKMLVKYKKGTMTPSRTTTRS